MSDKILLFTSRGQDFYIGDSVYLSGMKTKKYTLCGLSPINKTAVIFCGGNTYQEPLENLFKTPPLSTADALELANKLPILGCGNRYVPGMDLYLKREFRTPPIFLEKSYIRPLEGAICVYFSGGLHRTISGMEYLYSSEKAASIG